MQIDVRSVDNAVKLEEEFAVEVGKPDNAGEALATWKQQDRVGAVDGNGYVFVMRELQRGLADQAVAAGLLVECPDGFEGQRVQLAMVKMDAA